LKKIKEVEQEPTAERKIFLVNNLTVPSQSMENLLHSDPDLSAAGAGNIRESSSSSLLNSKNELILLKKRMTTKYSNEMRQELLGSLPMAKENAGVGGLRLRGSAVAISASGGGSKTDIDDVVRHHNHVQEELAEEMLKMTQSLKENVTLAGHVVREDNKTLGRTTLQADRNLTNLQKESARLETHARRSCDWGVYFLLGIVFVTFIGMVLFMRIFTKK